MTHADALALDAMRVFTLALVAATAAGIVLERDPLKQTIAVSFYGLILALMFFLFQAPDVALSQIVVGAVALPMMVLLALVKIRRNQAVRAHVHGEREKGGRDRHGEHDEKEART